MLHRGKIKASPSMLLRSPKKVLIDPSPSMYIKTGSFMTQSKKIQPVASQKCFLPKLSQRCDMYIRINIKSNWGHPSKVSLSSISVFGQDHKKLPVFDISLSPATAESQNIRALLDDNLVKQNTQSIWSSEWKNEEGFLLSIILAVPYIGQITSVRLWNPKVDDNSGVRNIEVFVSDGCECEGEIPIGFGTDLRPYRPMLSNTVKVSKILEEMFPEIVPPKLPSDSFGSIPVCVCSEVTVEVLSTYGSANSFGLNGIEVIDAQGNLIKRDQIKSVEVYNCGNHTDPMSLFRSNKATSYSDHMLHVNVNWNEIPSLKIVFYKKQSVSKINIFNYNAFGQDLDQSVKLVCVRIDKRLRWSGIIPRGTGLGADASTPSKSVFLCDISASCK